jgi:hypothetical protein
MQILEMQERQRQLQERSEKAASLLNEIEVMSSFSPELADHVVDHKRYAVGSLNGKLLIDVLQRGIESGITARQEIVAALLGIVEPNPDLQREPTNVELSA